MKIEFEKQDYINAITPFRNGCAFRLIVKQNGDLYLDTGCYCLYQLLSDAEYQFDKKITENNGPIKISVNPEIKRELLLVPPCKSCGGARVEVQDLSPMTNPTWKQII